MQSSSRTGGHMSRYLTPALLVAGCAFLAAGIVIGVGDNPPGLVLVYLAVSVWIVAFAHRWRRAKSFLVLLAVSLAGFPIAVVLHNVFYALAEVASDVAGLSQVLGFLEVVFFLIAIVVCPPGVLVGTVGSVVLALWRFRKGRMSDERP